MNQGPTRIDVRRSLAKASGRIALLFAFAAHASDDIPRVAFVCAICDDRVMNEVTRPVIAEFEKAGYSSGRKVVFVMLNSGSEASGVPSDSALKSLYARTEKSKPRVILPVDVYSSAAAIVVRDTPIVFGLSNVDALRLGLVAALSRPGTNMTGFTRGPENLDVKRLEILHEMVPRARRVAVLSQEGLPGLDGQAREVLSAGAGMNLEMAPFLARKGSTVAGDADDLFRRMGEANVDAFLLLDGNDWSDHFVSLAARYRLPTVYPYPGKGGLASYHQVDKPPSMIVAYAISILRGKRPSDMPVQQGSEFRLVLNARTARAMGLEFPAALKLQATRIRDK